MFTQKIRISALSAVILIAPLVSRSASAAYVFETATGGTLGAQGVYSAYGDGTDAGSNFIGATFSLTNAQSSLAVGGNFDQYGIGSVFAEVVSVSSLSSLPAVTGSGSNPLTTWLQANSLGTTLISAPTAPGDASSIINFTSTLSAGNYAVIFGSGLYGTSPVTGAFGQVQPQQLNFTDSSNGNMTIGSPTLFSSLGGDDFQSYGYDTGIRIFASPVPLPAALPLMISGLAALGTLSRRRSRKTTG